MLLKKIVVAEDDESIAHLINMALGDAGYLCIRARDGQEALSLVRMHTPDLLVLDVMMPIVDGLEVATRIKQDVILSRTPILMLTSLSSVDDKVEGFEAGADDYLPKPFDLREFAARVRALIRAAHRERERNPTTELPGSGAVEEHVEGLLGAGREAAVLQFDVRGFARLADQVGYNRTDGLVSSIGGMILDRTRASGEPGFVGHLGGVDFVAVVEPEVAEELAREVIAAFEDRRASWMELADPEGSVPARRADDRLSLAVTVVPTRGLAAGASDELAERMATAMRSSKQREGSNYVVWAADAG